MTLIFDVFCFSAASAVIRGWKAVAVTEFPPLPFSEPLCLCVAINPSKSLGQSTRSLRPGTDRPGSDQPIAPITGGRSGAFARPIHLVFACVSSLNSPSVA